MLYSVYLWLGVNPALYLIKRYREFFTDDWFFRRLFDFPGEPSEYLSRLVTLFYNYPLLSSLLVSVILLFVYRFGVTLFEGKISRHLLPCVAAFMLMLMHNEYGHDIRFDIQIVLLFAGLSLLVRSLKYPGKWLSFSVFPLLMALNFYLCGISMTMLFVCIAFAILVSRKEKHYLAWLVEALAVVFVFYFLFSLSSHDLKQELVDVSRIYSFRYFPFILYGIVCIAPVSCFAIRFLKIKNPVRTVFCLLFIPVVFLSLLFTLNLEEKRGFTVQHYALARNWEEVLLQARKCKYPDKNVAYYTNEALYHTGKIYDELFLYNQGFGSAGLMLSEENTMSEIVPNQQIFMYLGAISLSVKWGREAANVYGANPYVLKNLVKAYLAGGYIIEAQKILNLLDHTLFEKKWTAYYRQLANDTARITQDSELKQIRESMTPVAVVARQNPIMNLPYLAQYPGINKMAYDYLLTASLLDHHVQRFAFYVTRLKDFGYKHIPKLYLEGLIYISLYTENPLDMGEYTFDMNIVDRFQSFQNELISIASKHSEKARDVLKSRYGDTYWYYLLFQSPLGNEEKKEAFLRMTQ
jgi:hypothetical protein